MNIQPGLILVGRFVGIKQKEGVSRKTNESYVMHYCGIEVPKSGGFPGETVVHECMVPKSLINQGFTQRANDFIGKDVTASIYVRTFTGRSGAQYSFNLTDSDDAVQLLNKAQVKAA
jgi:hypothetical protein